MNETENGIVRIQLQGKKQENNDMTKEEIQKLIDKKDKTPEEMRMIAESYLKGEILQDHIAAEAWFQKVIETGDNKDSLIAMVLLARKIWGKEIVISEKDFEDMRKDKTNEKYIDEITLYAQR